MWRSFPLVVVCLVCLFSVKAQTVNESETKIVLNEKTAEVFLVIENQSRNSNERITLELLDEKGLVKAQNSAVKAIKRGKETHKFIFQLGDLLEKTQSDISWHRLRYSVGNVSKGTVSLSQIVPDIFEIQVISMQDLMPGMTHRSRIRATNPFTLAPIQGVKIKAELLLELKSEDDEELKLSATGETDAEGFANLEFQIPIEANIDDAEIKITGQKNGIIRETEEDLQAMSDDFQFPMMVDKPIYQPEQTLNVRGVLLKGIEGKIVVPNAEVEFRIEDEDNRVLFQKKVTTSEFGVASMSWQIPENAKLGQYRIRVKNLAIDENVAYQSIKISRYDLPNFVVNGKALKKYYLPNEDEAEIEVTADYLFGKPVTNGKVRIVRETNRRWNWREQKYDIDEGESHEGTADKDGKFTAKFNLKKDHEDLKGNNYRKFEDLNFTAYYTDLTTNRTEQRRFDVRVTKEPIHVYLIGKNRVRHANLPVNAYVSAFYADGNPCLCEVKVKGREEYTKENFITLQKLKTNSLGGGKLNFFRPKFESLSDDLELEIVAQDAEGLKGTFGGEESYSWNRNLQFEDDNFLQIETEKTIFKPGESLKIKLNAAFKEDEENRSPKVFVDIVSGWTVVDSYFLTLKNGKGELKIPYNPKFKGELKIAAYFEVEDYARRWNYQSRNYEYRKGFEMVKTSRGIIYPYSDNLNIKTEFDKETYKPSDEAKASFSVLDSIGKAVESVLGIVIFDKAVEERAKTDGEFNGTLGNFYRWIGYGNSFGGINIKDINELDLTKPISNEMQLAAEIMLHDAYYEPSIYRSETTKTDAKSVFAEYFKKQFDPIETKLRSHFENKQFEHPIDDATLRKILSENGIDFDDLQDPWEQKYRAVFSVEQTNDVVRIISAGADKKFETDDDFTVSSMNFAYFKPMEIRLNKAFSDYYERIKQYIRDEKTLLQELDVPEIIDRFGNPYRIEFSISGRYIKTRIWSLGNNGKTDNEFRWDDFTIFDKQQDYFAVSEMEIRKVLAEAVRIPNNENELRALLNSKGIDLDQILDGWGEKVYVVKTEFSRYTDVYKEEIVSEYGKEETTKRKVLKPVTQGVISFQIRSKGVDKIENTNDDITLAQFLNVIWEQSKDDPKPVYKENYIGKPVKFEKGISTGAIQGTVTDASGAVIPGVAVSATNSETSESRSIETDSNGRYLIGNLSVGNYNVRVTASGFKDMVVQNVKVTTNGIAKVDLVLEVGSVSEVVSVAVDAAVINTENATISESKIEQLPVNGRKFLGLTKLEPGTITESQDSTSPNSTPKLREYFPETLFWSPELITDKNGKATINFKMADNITTWKVYTIASTKNGKFGVAEKEVLSFKSFFADLDPPKFLTESDEIHLPVQIRNYTNSKQKVNVTMSKADWFTFLSPEKQNVEVEKDKSENAVFGFKSIVPIKDGKQRVTAIATSDSDAIEKPVTVRPNGEEIINTETKLFNNSEIFAVNFPTNALPKTANAELKVYPNLLAHVTESIDGLLQRPYGCGEQTVSSTYPNLMILKYIKEENSLKRKARKYLQSGYERLLGYQASDGGFSYWGGKDSSNLALTAYALRFLSDAEDYISVDEKVIERAEKYLLDQQRQDGSWSQKYHWQTVENLQQTKMNTTYVAYILAKIGTDKLSLDKALAYLQKSNAEMDEPYALALYALANFEADKKDEAEKTVSRLRNLGKKEGNRIYWNLETNTPFYGWGTAGRIETTALVIQSLLKSKETNPSLKINDELISGGMMFLLKNKDRYGVWYSTQTTINVLNTFLATLSEAKDQTITVSINGEKIQDFAVSAEQIEPITINLKEKLVGANQIEVKSSSDGSLMSQIVQKHYIDWKDSVSTKQDVNDSRAIQLDYSCDKMNPKIMDTVTCSVKAERLGFRGYGMLLAEIGVPPGADVSRESLEKSFESDWSLSRYEVLPDRIVVYMWAKAGGSKFDFSFKPRYGIKAKTPASIIYDYYNEESRGTVAPLNFEVK